MNVFKKLSTSILAVLFAGFVFTAQAQDINQAGALFNEGIQAVKAKDYTAAITKLSSGLDMCKTIGASADELKGKIASQLVKAHWKEAITLYKGKKFDEAVTALNTTNKVATELGDTKIAKKSKAIVPSVYIDKAKAMLKAKKYEQAHAAIAQSTAIKANSAKASYVEGLVFKGEGKTEQAGASFAKAIEQDKSQSKKYAKKAQSAAGKMFEAAAAKELQLEHTDKAISFLSEAVKYNDKSSNSFYMMAVAYNKAKQYDQAIEAAQKGLALEGNKNISATQFELGKAFEGKGDAAKACAAYKKVVDGPNAQAAQFQIKEVLKCK